MKIAMVYRPMKGMVMDVTEHHKSQLQAAFPDDEVYFARSMQELKDRGVRAECIIGGHPTLEMLPGEINFEEYCLWAGTVKWFHTMFTGVDAFAEDGAFSRCGVRLTNSGGISAYPISEQIIAFALCMARRLPQAFAKKARHVWSRPANADEIGGKTMGIIGLGNIGRATALKAHALGMRVIGYKRSPAQFDYVDEVCFGEEGLQFLLSQSDYVVMLLPNVPATYRFMNAERFAAMKDGAFFINQGRGVCVDTMAMIDALQSGKLGGVALDAVDPEPLPDDSPLWDMDNVILTAHYGGDSKYTFTRSIDLFIRNISLYRAGQRLTNEIDLFGNG